jgi:hypothetical protein
MTVSQRHSPRLNSHPAGDTLAPLVGRIFLTIWKIWISTLEMEGASEVALVSSSNSSPSSSQAMGCWVSLKMLLDSRRRECASVSHRSSVALEPKSYF